MHEIFGWLKISAELPTKLNEISLKISSETLIKKILPKFLLKKPTSK
jgi:hypothetical protein